jgi:hypothetical protein
VNARLRLLAVATTACAVLTGAALTSPAVAAGTAVTGGNVQIALSSHTVQVERGHGITVSPIAAATLRNGTLRLPVTGGTANRSNYTTKLGGGFKYTKSSHSVSITHIVMNTATHRASAAVTGHGTIDVFILGDPNAGSGGPGKVQFGGYSVKLTGALTRALDNAFNSQTFGNNAGFGTGSTTVTFKA